MKKQTDTYLNIYKNILIRSLVKHFFKITMHNCHSRQGLTLLIRRISNDTKISFSFSFFLELWL